MMIPEQISNQILEVRNLLEEILNEVQNDALRYNEIQISKQSNYQYLLNSIDSNQLEKCLIDSKYLNVDREVFNGIVSTINAYKNYYNRNQKKFESFDLGKLYEVYLNINFDKEIAIFKNDVLEVEDSKNPL
ncbi:hypothetical protein, partial [Chryseobacterium sp.]|uniref:hypothetical protein n=1 Tax=Chryseobacterium sp. TaxID=1871047 RepID=UPI0028A09B1A